MFEGFETVLDHILEGGGQVQQTNLPERVVSQSKYVWRSKVSILEHVLTFIEAYSELVATL